MSDLLSIGKSGVLAYQHALAGISENVVNANTEGYARRVVTLKDQSSDGGPIFNYRTSTAFNGVQAADVSRVWDQFAAQKAWGANSDNSQASARSKVFSDVQDALNDGDAGVGVKLTAIFTSANALAANPTDGTLRQSFLYALQDAAGAIKGTASTLTTIASTVATQATNAVGQVNDALTALAKINLSLKTAPQGTTGRAALEDQRDALIGTISDKVGIDVTLDNYGSATLRMNDLGGPVLLDGNSITPSVLGLQVSSTGTLGMSVSSGGTSLSVSATSGALAGYAEAANQVAGRRQQMDTLAVDLAQKMNAWNAGGVDLNGNPGAGLMSGTDAASLTVSVTDPKLVAASDGTSANGNLLAPLAALRGADGVEATWRGITNEQALRVQSAQTSAKNAASAKDGAYAALDDMTGVDLDTEAADLMRFQQCYSASSKILQTARQTLQDILALF